MFEAAGEQPLDTIRVPEFFTYNGFYQAFIARLPDIAERIKKDRWVLGAAGEQDALATQYATLPDDLLDLYTKDFLAAWRDALSKLRLKKLTADKPTLRGAVRNLGADLAAAAILVSMREETTLTRERPPPKPAGGQPAAAPATPTPPKPATPAILFKSSGSRAGRQHRSRLPRVPSRRRGRAHAHADRHGRRQSESRFRKA